MFVAGLAVGAKIDFATSLAIVSDPGVDSMVVLLRAIDMPRDMAASILMLMQRLRDGPHPQPPKALVIAMESFDRLEIAGARSVLQLWRLDRQSRTAIDCVAAGAYWYATRASKPPTHIPHPS